MPQQPGNQCPFCQLVANPEQTFDVHETEHFKAWLDINPRAKGHTMIVPKEHLTSMDDISDHLGELMTMIKAVADKARNGLGADGVSVALNEGEAAGQNLEHFYVQVFPRFEGEENEGAPTGAIFQPLEGMDENDLQEFSEQMHNASFDAGGKPTKDGAATKMVQANRDGSTRTHSDQQEHRDDERLEDNGHEDSDNEETDDEDDEHWDGENYSWKDNHAEFK